jgi:hypothetical protein
VASISARIPLLSPGSAPSQRLGVYIVGRFLEVADADVRGVLSSERRKRRGRARVQTRRFKIVISADFIPVFFSLSPPILAWRIFSLKGDFAANHGEYGRKRFIEHAKSALLSA